MDRSEPPPPPPAPATLPAGVAVVGNPYSGRGANHQRVERLLASLEAAGLAPRIAWAPPDRRAMLADPGLAQWCRCVISAGGDGTLADVLNDLADGGSAGVPLAMLPIGNENLFAREFGFEVSPEHIAHAVVRGKTCCIDLGVCNGRLFSLMMSAGFDAEVVHRVDRWRVRPDGNGLRRANRLSYGPRILGALRGYGYPRVQVEADGVVVAEGAHVFVFNLPQYGVHLGLCRHAVCDDGLLDWVVFQRAGWWSLMRYGWSVIRSRHLNRADVLHGQAKHLRITTTSDHVPPVPIQADGDPAGHGPVEVELHPQALRVLDMRAD